jgi:hypothetical protein
VQTASHLPTILQDLAKQQATGRLLVKLPGALATVYLKLGAVVHATFGVKKGPEALELMLQATPESSEFRANLTTPEMTIQAPLESLLGSVPSANPAPTVPAVTRPEVTASAVTTPGVTRPAPNPSPPRPASGEAVPEGFMGDLSKTLIEIMGPIGSIVLDDALTDLNLPNTVPKQALPSLLAELSKQLKNPARQQPFTQKSTVLLARYGLS